MSLPPSPCSLEEMKGCVLAIASTLNSVRLKSVCMCVHVRGPWWELAFTLSVARSHAGSILSLPEILEVILMIPIHVGFEYTHYTFLNVCIKKKKKEKKNPVQVILKIRPSVEI